MVLEEELKKLKVACVGSDLGTGLFIELHKVYIKMVELIGVSEEDVLGEVDGGFVANVAFADVVSKYLVIIISLGLLQLHLSSSHL